MYVYSVSTYFQIAFPCCKTLFVFVCALRCPRHIVDIDYMTGADLGFQGGAHLKKLRRAEEGTNILSTYFQIAFPCCKKSL
jgi:hypothetical protein